MTRAYNRLQSNGRDILKNHLHRPIFQAIWWSYYRRAESIYQIHSPFLFEFLERIRPIITQPNLLMPNPGSDFDWWKRHWILPLCEEFQIRHCEFHFSDLKNNQGLQKKQIDILPEIEGVFGNPALGIPDRSPEVNYRRTITFEKLNLLSSFQEDVVRPTLNESTSTLTLITDIHADNLHYRNWLKNLNTGAFNFSIEMYNLGFLFINPVVDEPKHVTFIPWKYKPWKILTI